MGYFKLFVPFPNIIFSEINKLIAPLKLELPIFGFTIHTLDKSCDTRFQTIENNNGKIIASS